MRRTYRMGAGQAVVLIATVVAIVIGVAWILYEVGVLPALG